MILSKEAILEELEKGNIVFDGKLSQIQNQSIDVSLGSEILVCSPKKLNFCDKIIIEKLFKYTFVEIEGLNDSYKFYKFDIQKKQKSLSRGVFFLAHTNEFVGTRIGSNIHCQFQQTSTSARLGLIHPKAGWGDVGYINRWAMEFYCAKDITIKAGDIVGQMTFMYTTPTQTDYALNGQYQSTNNLEELKKNWKIENILPRKTLKNIEGLQ